VFRQFVDKEIPGLVMWLNSRIAELLAGMHEPLFSIPSTKKRKRKRREQKK
jgi:hypothetical protein